MRIYYDTEFLEDGATIALISIGMVAEDGRRLYAVNAEAPWERIKQRDWLVRHVLPSLPLVNRAALDRYLAHPAGRDSPVPPLDALAIDRTAGEVKPHAEIAIAVRDFIAATPDVELWAWYGAFDHVVLSWLWGPMAAHPEGVPMWTNDLRQEARRLGDPEMPVQAEGVHNALADAEHNRVMGAFLAGLAAAEDQAAGAGAVNA